MSRAWWLVLGMALTAAVPSLAGDVQVLCEPGLRVYLDDQFVGVSTAKEGGLLLADVGPGRHHLWVEKDGCLSQGFPVEVDDVPFEVRVGGFQPLPHAELERTPQPVPPSTPQLAAEASPTPGTKVQPEPRPAPVSSAAPVGSLEIVSTPEDCRVEIDGASYPKDVSRLFLSGLTAGRHTVSFRRTGYPPVTGEVEVEPGAQVTVRGNLESGRLEVVHEGKGSLRVYSKPTSCTIHFMGRLIEKTSPVLNLSFIPAGEHPLVAEWAGRRLTTTITVKRDQRTVVDISFGSSGEPFSVTYEAQ